MCQSNMAALLRATALFIRGYECSSPFAPRVFDRRICGDTALLRQPYLGAPTICRQLSTFALYCLQHVSAPVLCCSLYSPALAGSRSRQEAWTWEKCVVAPLSSPARRANPPSPSPPRHRHSRRLRAPPTRLPHTETSSGADRKP